MLVTGGGGTGYHPNPRVKASHPSHTIRMRRNESWMTLFSPLMFKVSTSDYGVLALASMFVKLQMRKQVAREIVRLGKWGISSLDANGEASKPFPYKGKIFSPFRHPFSNYSASIPHQPYSPVLLLIHLSYISGSKSYFWKYIFSWPTLASIVSGVSLLFSIWLLGQTTHIFSYLHSTLICLTHSPSLCLFILPMMLSPLCSPFLIDLIIILLILRELSHYLVTVTCRTSHTLGTINV